MKALQWSMSIPRKNQKDFVKWFEQISSPVLGGFGAKKHELFKVQDEQIMGRQLKEKNRFIERIYFDDGFSISDYFNAVKKDARAWKVSREYESKFGAADIELRVLNSV